MNKKKTLYFIYCLVLLLFAILTFSTRTYVREGGSYSSKNEVALYLMKYEKLPDNYTSNYGGTQPKDGSYGGGKTFYYKGEITDYISSDYDGKLKECDIEYPTDSDLRGLNRLVYTTDYEYVFYTDNHYGQSKTSVNEKAFHRVTRSSINGFANFCLIISLIMILVGISYLIYLKEEKTNENKNMLKQILLNCLYIIIGLILLPFIAIYYLIKHIKTKLKKAR